MRYSESHKAETRERILKSAASRYREAGIDGASLPDIMKDAGLTVGGFYRHFDSKEDLFAATMDRSLEDTLDIFDRSDDGCSGDVWAQSVAKVYLSMAHRANQAGGCPLPALAGDVARSDGPVRSRSQSNLETLAETIAQRLGGSNEDEAWAFLATLVGGLVLSRMVEDDDLALSVLHACRDHASACAKPTSGNGAS
jgi:TetR/AcrR family transcriptional repressor of nem operon